MIKLRTLRWGDYPRVSGRPSAIAGSLQGEAGGGGQGGVLTDLERNSACWKWQRGQTSHAGGHRMLGRAREQTLGASRGNQHYQQLETTEMDSKFLAS